MEIPTTRYAWNGDVALAYQVVGEGVADLVCLQGFCSHIDLGWESPYLSAFLQGLARTSRLILTDRRGWGCSDRFSVNDVPAFETMSDDLLTVLDAVGSERTAIFATSECTPLAALFAATYPERVSALILCDCFVTYVATDETPWMWRMSEWEEGFDEWRTTYPKASWWDGPDPHPEKEWFERYVRASVAPGALIAEMRQFMGTDIRPILPTVTVPTLVIADPGGDEDLDPRAGRLVADRIVGARFVEIPRPEGDLNWPVWYGRGDAILREVAGFIVDLRDEEARFDRVLATVLFTDIVDSTSVAASLGDHEWKDLLERHHTIVRGLLARYRGTEVDTAGDGFLATFDGPARSVRCAQAIGEALRPLGLEIRAGVHTGEVETIDGKVGGMAVVIGARVGALATRSEVLVSQTVKDLTAGSGLVFDDAGEHELKGVPDRWRLYRVVS